MVNGGWWDKTSVQWFVHSNCLGSLGFLFSLSRIGGRLSVDEPLIPNPSPQVGRMEQEPTGWGGWGILFGVQTLTQGSCAHA